MHVVFDHEPTPLIQRVLALSGAGPSCRQTVADIVSSGPQDAVVEFMNTQVATATLEPSFGCRMLRDLTAPVPPPSRPSRDYLRYWVLRLRPTTTEAQIVQLAETLNQRAGVEKSVPVPTSRPPDGPVPDPFVGDDATCARTVDHLVGTQWYLHQIGALTASSGLWPASGTTPVVAIVDFGFLTTHQELKGLQMEMAYNACDGSGNVGDPNPDRYHGTGVAALLGASADGVAMQGVAPGIETWPILGSCSNTVDGISWAMAIEHVRAMDIGERRKIVLLEVQTGAQESYESDPAVSKAIVEARDDDVVVVMAAGNGKLDAGLTVGGADFDATGAIVVGATAYGAPDHAASFSNFGDRVLVWAPGDPTYDLTASDESDNAYTMALGYTSGAAPKVAGVVALMLTKNPTLSEGAVREILAQAGRDVVDQKGNQLDAVDALERTPPP